MGKDIVKELLLAFKSERNKTMAYLVCMLGLTVQEVQTLTPEKARVLNQSRRSGNPAVESMLKKWEYKNGNGLMFKSVIYKGILDPSAIFRVFSPIIKKVMDSSGGISALKKVFVSLTSKIAPPPETKEKVAKFIAKFIATGKTVGKIPTMSWLQPGIYDDSVEVSYFGDDEMMVLRLN